MIGQPIKSTPSGARLGVTIPEILNLKTLRRFLLFLIPIYDLVQIFNVLQNLETVF